MMTVKELIEVLQGLPSDLAVVLRDDDGDEWPVSGAERAQLGGWGSCVEIKVRPWRG